MKEVRIGIVGAGGQRCCFHGGCMFNKTPGSVVAALCDNKPDRLQYAKKMYEETLGYEVDTYLDYNEMYEKAKLDAVFVSGPNNKHLDMSVSAMRAGLDVLCEKPMEITLERADKMVAVMKETKRLLGFGMQMHYRRRYLKVQQLIEAGRIGKIAQVWCSEFRGTYKEMKDWVWNPAESGGAIFEKNCHHYDIMDMWVKSMPTTVYASGNIMKHHKPHGYPSKIIDNAYIVNDYESGARGMVSICFTGDGQHYREFGVHGTEGKIFFSHKDHEKIHLSCNNGDVEIFDIPGEIRGDMFEDFVNCVREGKQPLVTPEMARRSLLVPMAAELSIAEKRIVNVSELK